MDQRSAAMAVTLRAAEATGVGSLPGSDPLEWCRVIAGELPGFPHVPELPGRGPGADMLGRALGMLARVDAGLTAETTAEGWRLSPRTRGANRVMRRARGWFAEDLDAAEATWADHAGPLKIQAVGPLTVAAGVELPSGERMLADMGAVREVGEALAVAVGDQVAECGRRFPKAAIVAQIDEPSAPAVIAGRVGTQSGAGRYWPVNERVAEELVAQVVRGAVTAGAAAAIHCCASDAPVALFTRTGAAALSVDLTIPQLHDDIASAIEAGVTLMAGLDLVSPTRGEGSWDAAGPLRDLLARTGLNQQKTASQVVITPSCGLAGFAPDAARRAYERAAALGTAWRRGDERVTDGPAGGTR